MVIGMREHRVALWVVEPALYICAGAVDLASAGNAAQLPIHVVYVNHVEVESVIDYVPPLVDGATYVTTSAKYANVGGWIEWEIAQAEAAGGYISFHMSGAYAERAVAPGDQALSAGPTGPPSHSSVMEPIRIGST